MASYSAFPKDVLIIGSGAGGLSTAIILAKLGFKVTVLEKNSQPGGVLRSYRRDGIECPVGVHYLGSLDPGQVLRKFFDYLGVTAAIPVVRMGANGIVDRYLFAGGDEQPAVFDLPPGLAGLEENLRQTFPDEQATITKIIAPIRQAAGQLHALDILYATGSDFALLDQSQPLGEILDELHCSPGLRSVLAIPSCWIGVPLDDCPAYYHSMALASYASSSYRLLGSGSTMAEALTQRLLDLGGSIITGADITNILVTARQVTGVQLASGECLHASTVIGAVHPKQVLQMLPDGAVKPSYRQRISGLQDTHGIFSLHASLDSASHPEIPYNIFKINRDHKGNVQDLKYYQIRTSEKAGRSLLSILTSGKDELWASWQETTSGRRGPDYLEAKEQQAQQLIAEAEELFGSFQGLKILDTFTPLTMRDWVNSPGGSAYGVLRSASQTLSTALLNRTSVQGLYLAGQNVMAPGIIGTIMGSFSTVKLLLGAEEFRQAVRL